MKDTKSLLKEAREAIKNKNYETSLKLCKQVLKEEKDNYMALVFLGVSLQETGQGSKALSAFQEATKANPSNFLAWNGLINYYEKNDTKETRELLIEAYLSLLNTDINEKKILDSIQKLCDICEYGNPEKIASAIYLLIKNEKCAEITEMAVGIVNILSKVKNMSSDSVKIYEDALKIVLNDQKTICTQYYADYLNLLYKLNRYAELLDHAKKMHSLFELDWVSLRWICKIFNEFYVETGNKIENEEEIRNYCESLMKLERQSATALFTKSILLVEEKKIIEAKELLDKVVGLLPGLLHAWILLLKCCIKLFLFSDAIKAANKTDKLMQSSGDTRKKLKEDVDVLIVEALSRSPEKEDLERVLEFFETLDDPCKLSVLQHVIRANINLNKFVEAKLLLADFKKELENETTYKLLTAQLLHKQRKYTEALELLVDDDVSNFEWWLEIGTLYWDSEQYDKSLIPFLKATKLDSTNYRCFLLLGHYYKRNNDFDKARRCYEKAFKINTTCAEAGIELSKIYRKFKNWDANLKLLQALTGEIINKKNSWAWMQLGLHFLEQLEYDKAINNLRFVIRVDESNLHCWESLADAYLAKGAYMSALKCYEKTSSLSEKTMLYPLLQRAHIKQILGEFAEARADFEEILKSNKCYVPALKGMAETCLLQAKECFKDKRLGTSRDNAQCAADNLIIGLSQRSDLTCLWKLLAESCMFVTNLPEKYCCLLLPSLFVEGKDIGGNKILEKTDLLTLASRCYSKALQEDNILIWHDLAVSYLTHAAFTDSKELFEQLIGKAQAIAHYCTSKNATYWQHWNLLGNIAMNLDPPNYKLAQHSFIKAVIANKNSAVSWSNLGTLYLILEDYKLANEAFTQAQRSDPNYVNSWIGQALLAEGLAHEDAMDLYRHSTQLSVHKQGALGYAHWVCKTLKKSPLDSIIYSIHNMHAVPVACDAMTWYTELDPMDATAWNMLGILKERMGLKAGALEAFKNALSLSNENHRDFARVNYGRLLVSVGKYSQAIDVLTKVEAATFNSGSALALALFKDKHYKESYEAYESTLHWLSDESHFQSDLLVALASMAYMFEGPEAAKTLLFQSIQIEKPSLWGFYATLSLGLLHEDFNLTELVLTELEKFKDRKECVSHFAMLTGYFYLLRGDDKRSIREISKIVHIHPDQATIWLTLSSLLIRLRTGRKSSRAAANCSQVAMKLGQTNMDVTKVLCLVSLCYFVTSDTKNALLMAQKAVHCYPNVAENWAVFIAATLSTKKMTGSYVKNVTEFVASLDVSEGLSGWLQKIIH